MSKESIKHLTENQTQLDADGAMVGVSRQALDESILYIKELTKKGQVLVDKINNTAPGQGWANEVGKAADDLEVELKK